MTLRIYRVRLKADLGRGLLVRAHHPANALMVLARKRCRSAPADQETLYRLVCEGVRLSQGGRPAGTKHARIFIVHDIEADHVALVRAFTPGDSIWLVFGDLYDHCLISDAQVADYVAAGEAILDWHDSPPTLEANQLD